MTHVDPNERQDAPRGEQGPKPEPTPDHPTPTSDDPGTGGSEEEAAGEATREADDNPSN